MTATTDAVLGLGSNIGERQVALAAAVDALRGHRDIQIIAASPLYESEPWGMTCQQDFLNAALLVGQTPWRALVER